MVLKYAILMVLLSVFLTACGISPTNKQVIPAYSDPDEAHVSTEALGNTQEQTQSPQTKSVFKKRPVKKSLPISKQQRNTAGIPSPEIVSSLIERAQKAMSKQQWLRAQHALEQALHIAPNDGKVFLNYGDVYLNLGILEQAEQMYRRAISLAGEESALGRSAVNKLNSLLSQ